MSAIASERKRVSFRTAGILAVFALLACSPAAVARDSQGGERPAALERGIDAYWNADYDTARTELSTVAASGLAGEDRVLLHKFLGLCAFAQKQEAEARRHFEEILTLDPGYRFQADDVAPPILQAFDLTLDRMLKDAYQRGKKAYQARRPREAAAYFEKAVALDPSDAYAEAFLKLATLDSGRSR
jgi:tetratricopeptide (TPR) repeat protein